MRRSLLTVLFTLIWLNVTVLCQSKQILNEINNIKYLAQDFVYIFDFRYSSGASGLEEPIIGKGIIKYIPNDTLDYHFDLLMLHDVGVSNNIYSGKRLEIIDHKKNECISINLDSFKVGLNWITGNVMNSIIPSFLFDSVYFDEIIEAEGLINHTISDEFIFGRQCKKLRFKFDDNEELINNISNYYFDPQTLTCIGYRDSFELAGTKLTQSLIVFNIFKTDDSGERIFTSDIYKDLGYTFKYPQEEVTTEQKKAEVKEFEETKSSDLAAFDFEKYKGEVLVLDFWYIGCAPCLKLIPVMENLYEEFPNVSFIGMNVRDKSDKIKKFVEKRGIKYPVFPDDQGLSKIYEMKGFPIVLIFNKSGNLVKRFDGYSDAIYDEIKSVIEEEIKK